MGLDPAGSAGSSPGSPPQACLGPADAVPNTDELKLLPADFWIYSYKIVPCENTEPHDWEDCLYSHKGEKAKRRDPSLYRALQCPEARTKRICPRGEQCPCTHSLFEYWLHPDKFRTCMCEFGADCRRRVCFFAHNAAELRKPPNGDVVVDALAPASSKKDEDAAATLKAGGTSFRSSDSDDLSASSSMHDQQQHGRPGSSSHQLNRSHSGRHQGSVHGVASGAMLGGAGVLSAHGYGPSSPMPPGLNGGASLHHHHASLGALPPSVLEEAAGQLQHPLAGNGSYLSAGGAVAAAQQQADLLWDAGMGGMQLAEESYGPIGGFGDSWSPLDLAAGYQADAGNGRSGAAAQHLSGGSHASTGSLNSSMGAISLMCSPTTDAAIASGGSDAWGGFSAGALGSSGATARRMASLGLPPRTASMPGVYHRGANGGLAGVAGISRTSSGALGSGDSGAILDAQAQLLQLQELQRLRSHSFDVPASMGQQQSTQASSQLQQLAQLQQQQLAAQQQAQQQQEPVAAQLAQLQQMRAHSFDTPYSLRSMQQMQQQIAAQQPVRKPSATVQSLAVDIMSLDSSDRRALLQHLLQMQS